MAMKRLLILINIAALTQDTDTDTHRGTGDALAGEDKEKPLREALVTRTHTPQDSQG